MNYLKSNALRKTILPAGVASLMLCAAVSAAAPGNVANEELYSKAPQLSAQQLASNSGKVRQRLQAANQRLQSLTSFKPEPLTLQKVEAFGDIPFDTAASAALTELYGKELSRSLLDSVMKELNHYYQDLGYRQMQTLLPEQFFKQDGVLKVFLASPTLGETEVEQSPEDFLRPGAVQTLFADFEDLQGSPVNEKELESQILKLSDLGIFSLQGSFSQSPHSPHVQDLTLKSTPTKDFGFNLFADNHGTKAAGEYRTGALFNWLNPTGSADLLSLFYARSSHRQNNYSFGYQIPVSSHPTVIGGSVCLSDYELGREYEDLGAEGKSLEFSLFVREPLYRDLRQRTELNLGWRYRSLTDEFTQFDLKFRQHSHALWAAVDEAYAGDMFSFAGRASLTLGKLENDDDFELYDESFFKILNLNALLSLKANSHLSFNAALEAQLTPDDVDSSEEFTAGGALAVSGFDSNVLSGDSGALLKLYPEIRPFAGVDFAIRPNVKGALVKDQDYPADTLMSAGIEFAASYQGFYANLSFDAALGDKPYSDLDAGKVWFEIGYRL